MKTVHRTCPACDSNSVELLYHQEFVLPDESPLSSRYDVVLCQQCGLAFADTATSQATYDRFFVVSSIYEDTKTSIGLGGTASDTARLEATADTIAEAFGDKNIRIADIGCGGGGVLAKLKERGYKNLTGVDPSAACVRHINENLGIEALQGLLGALPLADRQFDLIILSHVLEHVRSFESIGQLFADNLSEVGRAYLEVPDSARYADHIASPFQDFNTEHINHFSFDTLCNLVLKFNLEPQERGEKDILQDGGWKYPAFYGIFKQRENTENMVLTPPDPRFKNSMERYIRESDKLLDHLESQIAPHVEYGQPLIIWGTGQLTYKLLALTSLKKANIQFFVDSNPVNQGKHLRQAPILPPAKLTSSETAILLGTTLHSASIAKTIKEDLGLKNPLIFLSLN